MTLIGLPNKVTTDVKKITKDTKDLVFHIKTDKASPAGNHQNLFCQVVVTQDGEPIVHNLGHAASSGSTCPCRPSRTPPPPRSGRRGRRPKPAAPAAPPRSR